MNIVDRKELTVLTEWCRNKPEAAACEILSFKNTNKEVNSVKPYRYVVCNNYSVPKAQSEEFNDKLHVCRIGFTFHETECIDYISRYLKLENVLGVEISSTDKVIFKGTFNTEQIKKVLSRIRR